MEIIPRPQEVSFDKGDHQGRAYDTRELLGEDLNILEITTETGLDVTLRQRECTFAYLILEGDGYFEIEGAEHPCQEGDMVIVRPGEAFTYKGRLRMLLINRPGWSEDQEEVL